MSNALLLPPDLRLLTTQLTSLPPPQLLLLLPTLTGHALRCREALLRPLDQKPVHNGGSGGAIATEAQNLVQRLRASITGLLVGRAPEGRLVGAALAKTVVDIGGWESLRASEPWVRGLLAGLQRTDPFPIKELCLVTLARIFVLAHGYPTLVREIVTPTLPAFMTALLSLLSMTPATAKNQKTTPPVPPASLITLAAEAIGTLIPVYPTTIRPFATQIRTALRLYLAPTTGATPLPVPEALRRASRRAVVLLHHVAPKAGGSGDWAAFVRAMLRDCHNAADQVFRPVDEAWRSGYGHVRARVDFDQQPHGGGTGADELPPWKGTKAGVERLIGVLGCLAATLKHPTKTAVAIPVGALVDLTSRISLIARHSPRSQTWDQALPTNSAAQRDEKDQLWAAMPQVHIAMMELLLTLVKRLRSNVFPIIDEIVESLIRVFRSGMEVREVRVAAYVLLRTLLSICGPSLPKTTVTSLDPLISACCRDIQQACGFLQPPTPEAAPSSDPKKQKPTLANADMFLAAPSAAATASASIHPPLPPRHRSAAESLLVGLLANLPQAHVKPPARALLDQTAVVSQSRDALMASVLSPYRTPSGRMYASLMPFLAGMYSGEQCVEVLRSNLRADGGASQGWAEVEVLGEDYDEDEEQDDDDNIGQNGATLGETAPEDPDAMVTDTMPVATNPFAASVRSTTTTAVKTTNPFTSPSLSSSPLKRPSSETTDPRPAKRHESLVIEHVVAEQSQPTVADRTILSKSADPAASHDNNNDNNNDDDGDDDDDDESVHLNMEFDDDEEGDDA